jgi:CubicO group peptidase (beta-lactamase class C family)
MNSMRSFSSGLQSYVEQLVASNYAPGISIALWRHGETFAGAAGITNVGIGNPVTINTLFQIGSITKAFTASLLMKYVTEGHLNLDAPLNNYLRDFHVLDSSAVREITTRHLLSHTSGLETDIYFDDGAEQGNPITRYLDRCFLLPQVHTDFGRRFSYSNVGYVALGLLVELLSRQTWNEAIDSFVFKPLGMKQALSSPLQVPSFDVAAGHLYVDGAAPSWRADEKPFVPRGLAPAGSVLAMSMSDLVRFGRAHLDCGLAADGTRWLPADIVRGMQKSQVTLPCVTTLYNTAWGLGWGLNDFGSIRAYGHGGGRIGFQALLFIVPSQNAVLGIGANGMMLGAGPLVRQVLQDFMSETANLSINTIPQPARCRNLERYTGTYGGIGFRSVVTAHADRLSLEFSLNGLLADRSNLYLLPNTNGTFAVYSTAGALLEQEVAFLTEGADNRPKYLFFASRLNKRLSE